MGIRLDHIGIAVNDLEQGVKFWELLGLTTSKEVETNEEQGVKILFLSTTEGPSPDIELLEPTGPDTPIGQFISKRGPGIQQLAFEVDDISQIISQLQSNGVEMIDEIPKIGAGGNKIAFVHPKSTGGVLVELVEKK
ncbi:methylmalonyl-CoA epimerase [Euryarchaeota archaeon]|nr:methylmalonyl-CoA epimerase [Euryarchaeota archaeon]|tara:strand:+ start:780 stop:1190 length:411 start_codon:yes stop_codon:yes gene_type:complete